MYTIYIDSGTSNSKLYLVKDRQSIDTQIANVGTKDSAITGSNDVLLSGLKQLYDTVLERNQLAEADIAHVCLSGMVTNPFGITEVPHLSTPIDASKLWDNRHVHFEDRYFHRELLLICGAKTAQPNQVVTMENIDQMNNVRGEEIEAIGMVAEGVFGDAEGVMISPGSHTHMLYIKDGAITDIISNFTGELTYAIQTQTILGGELAKGDVPLDADVILQGYHMIKQYGLARALYIVHATKVFAVCEDAHRSALLMGMIAGGVMDMLQYKLEREWKNSKKCVIIGGKHYIDAYQIIGKEISPDLHIETIVPKSGESYALCGYYAMTK